MVIVMNIAPSIHFSPEEICRLTWRINRTNDIYPPTYISSQLSVSVALELGCKVDGQVFKLKLVSILGFSISGWGDLCGLLRGVTRI